MKDANGRILEIYQRVSCTDRDGNVRVGIINRMEEYTPRRCGGDEGDVLIVCDNREQVWTVPSDVEVL